MLNRLARAGMETRMALHYEREINKALGRPADERSDSARSRIRSVGEAVVQYMLFRDEARLTDRIEGTSSFASDFAARGPRDSKGRSLRDFDLKTRLFRYPCSYLIYSRAFDSLPGEVKEYIYQRLWEILNGRADREGRPSSRRGRSRGDPRDPPRNEAGPAGLLEVAPSAPRPADRGLTGKMDATHGTSIEPSRDGRITPAALLMACP